MAYKNHRDLIVWQNAIKFASRIYAITNDFPKSETYGLISQIQRAAVSISSNIAEGHGRDSDKEMDRFLRISIGSTCEVDSQIEIAYNLGYIDSNTKQSIAIDIESLLKSLYSFRKAVLKRIESKESSTKL